MKRAILSVIVALPMGMLFGGCAHSSRTRYMAESRQPAARTVSVEEQTDGTVRNPRVEDRSDPRSSTRNVSLRDERTTRASRHEVSLSDIRDHVENGSAVLIDARSPEQYARGHVRGAVNVPAGQMNAYMDQILNTVSPDQLVIVYCDGQWCHASDMVSERLTELGFTNVQVYKPGWLVLSSSKSLR